MIERTRMALLMLLLNVASSRADFLVPTAATFGWNRPTSLNSRSTFQAWETFATTTGPNAAQTVFGIGSGATANVTHTPPTSDRYGFGGASGAVWSTVNAGTPNAIDASSNSFITSGGNIYSFSGLVTPRITVPNNLDNTPGTNPNGKTTILLQLRLQGSDFLPSSVSLLGTPGSTLIVPTSTTLLATQALGGFGGTLPDYAIRFEVPGNADLYTIDFAAAGSSLSLDRVAVDTFWKVPKPRFDAIFFNAPEIPRSIERARSATPVPEPALWGLLAVAVCLGRRRA